MTNATRRILAGGLFMAVGVIFSAPLGSSLLLHWDWLFRDEPNHSVTLWSLVNLDNAGFIHYYRLVCTVGISLVAIGTGLVVLGTNGKQSGQGRRP